MKALLIACALVLMTTGCATKKFVKEEVSTSEQRTAEQLDELKQAVEATQTEIRDMAKELNLAIDDLEQNTDELATANQNLERIAEENAQMIVQMGQFRFQKTLSEADTSFASSSAELSDGAREQLDRFAQLLIQQNRLVHIEIQGHTDSTGDEEENLALGMARAEAVREYLYKNHDIPLHLMNVISFGSSNPAADNSTRDGRAKNRRVVMVVRVQVK